MKTNKIVTFRHRQALVITKREIKAYFTSPIAYIVTGLFLLASGFLFFNTFFLNKVAELRNFFELLPITLAFFIPAMTMRLIAEEKKTGSIETLLTLPVTICDVVLGKFLASFICGLVMLLPTISYAITCMIFGSPDAGPLIGGYLGAIFLIAAFCSIGLFATSVTKNQIIAFFIAFAICITLAMIDMFNVFFSGAIIPFINYLSANKHFESISRGILDTRDIIFFVSITVLFLAVTVHTLKTSGSRR